MCTRFWGHRDDLDMVSALEELIFYQGDIWEHMMTSQKDMGPRCWGWTTEKLLILSGAAEFFPSISHLLDLIRMQTLWGSKEDLGGRGLSQVSLLPSSFKEGF